MIRREEYLTQLNNIKKDGAEIIDYILFIDSIIDDLFQNNNIEIYYPKNLDYKLKNKGSFTESVGKLTKKQALLFRFVRM